MYNMPKQHIIHESSTKWRIDYLLNSGLWNSSKTCIKQHDYQRPWVALHVQRSKKWAFWPLWTRKVPPRTPHQMRTDFQIEFFCTKALTGKFLIKKPLIFHHSLKATLPVKYLAALWLVNDPAYTVSPCVLRCDVCYNAVLYITTALAREVMQ